MNEWMTERSTVDPQTSRPEPTEPFTSSSCCPAGNGLLVSLGGCAGLPASLPPSPVAYPDQREGLQSLIISLLFLPFCFSHDPSTVTTGGREWGFQEALALAVKTHPGDSGSWPCQLGGSRKCLSSRGAVENRKNQERELALNPSITN